MKIKIAVPNNDFYKPILANASQVCKDANVELIVTSEEQCQELMLNNLVNVALLSPYGYGLGVRKADYRIIPSVYLASENYTGLAAIHFKKGLDTLSKGASNFPNQYLSRIAKIMLAERYDLVLDFKEQKGSIEELLSSNDCCVAYGKTSSLDGALDVSEEWFMSYEAQMPLAIWVCRNEEDPENIENFVKLFIDDETVSSNFEEIIHDESDENIEVRAGKLIFKFNEESEDALENTMQLLYYHNLFSEIPAIKILGRDINPAEM